MAWKKGCEKVWVESDSFIDSSTRIIEGIVRSDNCFARDGPSFLTTYAIFYSISIGDPSICP
ncbi:uncharacterized protein G2W53_004210 [Senna tora]|uniref:Uncharacterized protein n=1 Tax=Senna tora TaxID=362788 RepID=A0A834XCG3_9FABA|nr:uncharacterized protein G2W53_004210 [Senna tora]